MSQENVELVRRAWEAVNRGDVEAMVDLVSPDVDLRPPSYLIDGVAFRGPAGVRDWAARLTETWSELEGRPREIAAGGDYVVMSIEMRMTGRESGVPLAQDVFIVYSFHAGKIAAVIAYPTAVEALEAVGLRE